MPYFSVFGRLKTDWPIYNGKAVLPDYASRRDMGLSKIAIRHFHQPSFSPLRESQENNG